MGAWLAQKLPAARGASSLAVVLVEEAAVVTPSAKERLDSPDAGGVAAASSASGGGHEPSAYAPLYCTSTKHPSQVDQIIFPTIRMCELLAYHLVSRHWDTT